MISIEDVKNLANLARIELSAGEEVKLQEDLESILGYVDELKAFSAGQDGEEVNTSLTTALVKNVTRGDDSPKVTGVETETLLAEAPAVHDNYVSVKAIM